VSSDPALPIVTHRLDNGLRVVLCESRGAPVVALQVWVEVGSADERLDQGGLAHVHEHMLFKGTGKRGVGAIASEIEAAGGEINAWTSYDQTVYHVVLASEFFDVALDVLADAVLHSAFDAEELSRELEVILEEIKRAEDQPASRVSRALFELAFESHPYARPVIGKSEVVERFSRDQVLEFYRSHYRADRLTIVATGDFDAEDALARIEQGFGSLGGGATPLPQRPTEAEQTAPRSRALSGDVEEAHLAVGFVGPSLNDPDLAAVDVLSVVLGQGESSRLCARLRDTDQLVNEIYAYAYTPRDAGLFVIGGSMPPESVAPALAAVGEEVAKLFIDDEIDEEEIEKARTILCSEAIYQRETVEGLARRLGFWTTMTGDPAFEQRYQAAVRAVGKEDLQRVARRYLSGERVSVVTVTKQALDDGELAAMVEGAFVKTPPSSSTSSLPEQIASDAGATWQSSPPSGAPERVCERLACGAQLIVESDRTNPIVTVRTAWLGGARSENAEQAGLSHLVSDLWVRGTDRLDAAAIARSVDGMAGRLDALAGRNSVGLRATFLKDAFDEGFGLFADCLQRPSFTEAELERSRRLALEDLKSRSDNPAGLCFELFARTLWKEHPYRRDVLGTADRVRVHTRDDVEGFFHQRVDPRHAVISFVGDIDIDEARTRATAALEGMVSKAPAPSSWAPPPEAAPEAPRVTRLVADRAQAHLVAGHRGLSLTDPDRYALEILCAALAGQGGRLFLELRDKQSLCYAVTAFSIEGLESGSFAVYMGTSPEKVDRALAGIEQLLADLVSDGLTDEELDRARRYLVGAHGIGLQRLGARGSTMAYNALYGLGYLAHTEAAERYAACTREDIRKVAERLLTTPRVTALVGPESVEGPEATEEGRALMA
jgi:zinc protease